MNEQEKPWWASKTVWGGLVAVIASILAAFGYDIGAADQEAIVGSIVSVVGAVGGLIAVYGRVKASRKIGKAK
ncbi:hypothetical protein Q673_02700 [Marinobacter sp. EN3]|uniref:hypothetical protein n=1 Tax=Marinobacter sp. EN3 TaxID=1397533 RepID=UPI0003B8AF1B|nr:hypothetical protein [Marinobacter sp. EN3]ERS12540.1 hypothetical protein Q673_02700 [Marinobacter sp. EN3]